MDIQELTQYFDTIKSGCDTPTRFDFGKQLIECNSTEFLDFHYQILQETETEKVLYNFICKKFNDRGNIGEDYLLGKIKSEQNDFNKATILQILGSFKYSNGKRLEETSDLARQFLKSGSDNLRCKAIWVIGWTGNLQDIDNISTLLFSDPNNENRCWAATSMMQIYFNHKEVAPKALGHLKIASETETELKALEGIVVAVQEITGKKLGLSSTSHGLPDKEKIEKALKKTKKILADK